MARESFTEEVMGVTDTIPHDMFFPFHSEMACATSPPPLLLFGMH